MSTVNTQALAGWPWAALRGEVSERQMSLAQKRAVDLAWLGHAAQSTVRSGEQTV